MENFTITFNGKTFTVREESYYHVNVANGKKVMGLYRRGTQYMGTTQVSSLKFFAGKNELNKMPRYAGGKKGFMHLLDLVEQD